MKNILDFIKEYQAIITVVISSLISYCIAKAKTKSEIDKLMLTWSRNDKTDFSKAFQQLLSTTSAYCQHQNYHIFENAISASATFLTLSPEEFQSLASEIDAALNNKNIEQVQNVREKLISLYSEWINQSE